MAAQPKKYQERYLDPGEYDLWDHFVYESKNGTLFHTSGWAEIIRETFNRSFKILVLEKNGAIEAGILFWPKHNMGIRSITQMAATTYQGILFKAPAAEKASSARARLHHLTGQLLDTLQAAYHFIEIPLTPDFDDVRPFQWRGFTATPAYTYRFTISPFDELSKQFSQSLRRKINVSEKRDMRILLSGDSGPLIRFVSDSYRHHGIRPPLAQTDLSRLLDHCLRRETGLLYYLVEGDQPIAGIFVLQDAQTVYALFSGIDSDHRDENYTEYLHAALLREAGMQNKTFDFLGANTSLFEQFKRSFGGSLTVFYNVYYVRNSFVHLIARLRRRQHRLLRNNPG